MLKVIKFSAVWCAPCQMLTPIFDAVASDFDGEVEFEHVDIDDDSAMAAEYGIRSVPTMVFERDGKRLDSLVGLVKKDAIVNKINSLKD